MTKPAPRTLSRRRLLSGVVLGAAMLVSGVAAAADARYPAAGRVVTIGGSLTEIVYALGEESRLAGRDSTSTWPPEASGLPDVGYMRALAPEGVLSIKPDLVIALEGSGPPEAVSVLARSGIDFVTVPESFDREGVLTKIRAVGAALGVEEKAARLEAAVAADLDRAREAAAAEGHEPARVLFILSMQGGRVLASGRNTAADGIIRLAGAENAIDAFEGYKPLNDEAIIAARPDFILMMDRGGDHGATADTLFAHPAIASTPAAAGRRLVRMDGGYLLGFGPRTARAIGDLAAAFDPGQ